MNCAHSQQHGIRSVSHPARPFLGTPRFFNTNQRPTYSRNRRVHVAVAKQDQPGTKGGLRVLEWTGGLLPQGQLVKTAKFGWQTLWLTFMRELAPQSSDGNYKRPSYTFQNRIGDPTFPPHGRYFLYLGNPCPWCHRVAMAVALRGLTDIITVVKAVDDPERASRGGWVFDSPEPAFGAKDLRQVYDACTPGGYRGRCTAPVLVDAQTRRIVCNESSQILRNLNEAEFSREGAGWIDLCPEDLKPEIEKWNERTYESVNNGVYKSGFSTTQIAYEAAQAALWSELAAIDAVLAHRRFLCGDRFTEADLRLFPTAVRFDAVYTVLFKCSARRWSDFPNLHAWLLDCAGLPLPGGITLADTVDVDDCRRSYFKQLFPLNPGGIVPTGPTAVELGLAGGQAAQQPSSRGPRDAPHVYYRKPGQ